MSTKTWTNESDFSEAEGNMDGVKYNASQLQLQLQDSWQSRTWLGATDETETWIADDPVYQTPVKRGKWIVDFDSGSATSGWGNLSWTNSGGGDCKGRVKSASSQANLELATWYPIGGGGWYTVQPQDVECPDGRWYRLEFVLEEGSTPEVEAINQNYGEDC